MNYIKLTASVGYFSGPTNIGVIRCGDGEAVVVDTGIEQSVAKKLVKALAGEGLRPAAIISTHSHADHIGGNSFLQSRLGVPVYASAGETAFIENPLLEPMFLLGGAASWKEMRSKFICAPASRVDGVIEKEGKATVGGVEVEIFFLPGHSVQQMGVLHDGVLFAGDAFIAPEYLAKHGIPYNTDIAEFLASLDRLLSVEACWTVPGHGEALRDPAGVVAENRTAIMDNLQAILEIVADPATLEEVMQRLARGRGITVGNAPLFFLYRTAVTAYLSHLEANGMVKCHLEDNRLLWCRAGC